jgi:hypothetical protein
MPAAFRRPRAHFETAVRRPRHEPTVHRLWAFVLKAGAGHVVHRELLHPAKRTTRFLCKLHPLLLVGERAQRVPAKKADTPGRAGKHKN